jgi:hypothetical protein
MLRVERTTGKLVRLNPTTLSDAAIGERSGLQELILANVSEFFREECQEVLFVVREEVEPSVNTADRIDLLAVDSQGKGVIIELKRGSNKRQLLQSLTYAAMVSDWDKSHFETHLPSAKRSSFEAFLNEHAIKKVNEFQRIILIAESFGFEVLRTTQWLTYSYGLNITCYQITLAKEEDTGLEYLSAVQLFPPRELAVQARRQGALRSEEGNKFAEIEELLESCSNQAVKTYFQASLTLRRNKRRDSLVFPPTGKMRYRVRPKGTYARVTQLGRFDGDESLWKKNFSSPSLLVHESDLRFRLVSDADIALFSKFAQEELPTIAWSKSSANDEDESTEED